MTFQEQVTRTSTPIGEAVTRHLEGTIVETTYRGHCSEALVKAVSELVPMVMREVPGVSWLVDMTGASSTDANARKPGLVIFEMFRSRGGNEFAVVLTQSSLRMLFTAVAFASGLPVKFFTTREQALVHLRCATTKRPV
jgi:hypothetical protein